MKLTAAYYRSSTDLQDGSVEYQQMLIQKYGLTKGIPIDIEYAEPAVSARKKKLNERAEMSRLMSDIRTGKIGSLLVYKRDRLARKVEEHIELYQLFKRFQVKVHFIATNESEMRFDVLGELMELLIGAMSQREGEQIAQRISDTRMSNFLSGKTIGKLPYGYKTNKEKTKIKQINEELKIVNFIFTEWNTDIYETVGQLAKKLNDDGIVRRGKEWTSGNVTDVLTNPIYMGVRMMIFKDETQEKHVPDIKIIEKEVFEKAQELIEKRRKPIPEKQDIYYLLDELLVCGLCEQRLSGNRRMKEGKFYNTYECKNHEVRLVQNQIEDLVYRRTNQFFKELLNSSFEELYESHSKKNLNEQVKIQKRLEVELAQVEDKLIVATNKWIRKDSKLNEEQVVKHSKSVKQIKAKLYELEIKKNEFQDIPLYAKQIKEEIISTKIWEHLKFGRKKQLLHDLVREIIVDSNSLQIIFKHPFIEAHEVIG